LRGINYGIVLEFGAWNLLKKPVIETGFFLWRLPSSFLGPSALVRTGSLGTHTIKHEALNSKL
jgi:hypothetical protein